MLSAPASPVFFFQMPVAELATRTGPTAGWSRSLSSAPVPSREHVADQRVAQLAAKGSKHEDPVPTATDGHSTWTCRMVRNIPNDYTRDDLVDLLESKNIQFDFLYLPIDWKKGANLGYAFINLASHDEAIRIQACLKGFSAWKVSSQKVCDVVWGKPEQQSLHSIVDRFRNSPVMHPDVPEAFKPLLFINQRRVAMPAPTRKLQQPQGF